MSTVLVAIASALLYVVAYHTYGRWLGRRVFTVDPSRVAPSVERSDGVDFVPSRREIVFGHHFTSIAGTGPIVGPAIAVIWGWVPALLWVLVGSIVMGAVHDFGSLVISMRHRGKTIGELSREVINPRVRVLFLLIILMALLIVLAVFGLVIATMFSMFPGSVWPLWLQIPIAVGLGVYLRRGGGLLRGSVAATVLLLGTVVLFAHLPESVGTLPEWLTGHISAAAFWTIVLLIYCFIASTLPVHVLLQPRDFINTHVLFVTMLLLLVGLLVAQPPIVADAVNTDPPGAPGFMPFLFITIACGAISGFHCMVASGTSSRQLRTEADARYVGYGAMLTEGFLAVLVILAACAGIGLGTAGGDAGVLTGSEAWRHHYGSWTGDSGLGVALAPFVIGAANAMGALWVPHEVAVLLVGVFVVCFAATTLDSATRLTRYVVTELGTGAGIESLGNRYLATTVAVVCAGALALSDAVYRPGEGVGWDLTQAGLGGLILWPMFGATNQLLGGLALLVLTVWLIRRGKPFWVTAVPMVFMLAMTGWALVELIGRFRAEAGSLHLLVLAVMVLALEVWMVAEAVIVVKREGPSWRRTAAAGEAV